MTPEELEEVKALQITGYSDGYQAGWNAALESAAMIVEENASGCTPTTGYILHSQAQAIRAQIRQ